MRRTHALWLSVLLIAATPVWVQSVWAQEPGPGIAGPPPVGWSSLPEPQQKLLENFRGQWDSLPPARQQALSNGAARWLQMTPEQREGARDRFQSWQRIAPQQRALIRQRWQRFQQLSPEQQAAVRQNYRAFSGLPPAQRQMLRQRWLNATPQQRMQMLQNQRARRMERGLPPFRGRAAPAPFPRR
jgi:hypothetical protein